VLKDGFQLLSCIHFLEVLIEKESNLYLNP